LSDFQDPPELILTFLQKWKEGFKIVNRTKVKSKENKVMFLIRKLFYNTIAKISATDQIKNFTGFSLYDRQFIEILRNIDDPYPYFRGLITELGFSRIEMPYTHPKLERVKTKNNFYTLYDIAILGFINYSKVPLRMASFIGFGVFLLSSLIAMFYLITNFFSGAGFQLE
jgi:hypothetical protein